MDSTDATLDVTFNRAPRWGAEFEALRAIILDCGLTEEVKWGWPCYTLEKSNVVLINGFKEYCALLFFKGELLADANGVLREIGEHTKGARQIRFTTVQDVAAMAPVVKAYVQEAIAVEKAGLKVDYKNNAELTFPEEFQSKLDQDPALKAAFEALTPGRQRAYNLYFSAPKQSKTRTARVEKCVQQILDGKGLND